MSTSSHIDVWNMHMQSCYLACSAPFVLSLYKFHSWWPRGRIVNKKVMVDFDITNIFTFMFWQALCNSSTTIVFISSLSIEAWFIDATINSLILIMGCVVAHMSSMAWCNGCSRRTLRQLPYPFVVMAFKVSFIWLHPLFLCYVLVPFSLHTVL